MWEKLKQQAAMYLLVLLIGAAAVAFSMKAYRGVRNTTVAKNWPVIQAVVVEASKTNEVFDRQPRATATVRFTYQASGTAIEGVERRDEVSIAEADELLKRYPKGHKFPIHVNPADPYEIAIDTTLTPKTYFHITFAVLAIIGTLVLFLSLIKDLFGSETESKMEEKGARR